MQHFFYTFYMPILVLLHTNRVVWKEGVYTAMVKDTFKDLDRVDTFCALLVDVGLPCTSTVATHSEKIT